LGISRGGGKIKGTWWCNEEVKEKVKAKQDAYSALINGRIDGEKEVNKVKYKFSKKIAKKDAAIAKSGSRTDGEKEVNKEQCI